MNGCFRPALLNSGLPFALAPGLGDMAVSNTIGSNVFDILVGLGVPWALQTMCVSYGSVVNNFSPPPPLI